MTWTTNLDHDRRTALMAALDRHGAEHLRYADGDRDFAAFLLYADALSRRRVGLSLFDLADYRWRDAFDDDATPAETLRAALADELG